MDRVLPRTKVLSNNCAENNLGGGFMSLPNGGSLRLLLAVCDVMYYMCVNWGASHELATYTHASSLHVSCEHELADAIRVCWIIHKT